MTPEIFHCVSDIVGDSLALAREAMKVDADVIVLAGVHFMAETAKLLNPAKTVLIPDTARRLLAGRIDHRGRCAPAARALSRRAGGDLREHLGRGEGGVRHLLHLRQRAQGHRIAGVDRVIMLPDEYLAQNIAAQTGVKIITWAGHCEVHERFTAAADPRAARRQSRRGGAGASGMPARGGRRGRLHRLDRRHVRLCREQEAGDGGADHRVLDGRQRLGASPGRASSSGRAISART